jgi:hypothetical protein
MKKFVSTSLALALSGSAAFAADHLDSPATQAEPAADINDLFAWTSTDGTKLNLVLTVFPAATEAAMFSDSVQYVFHTSSGATFGAAGTPMDIICQFDANQEIACWAGAADYASGDASATSGVESVNGKFRVFAGLRDDPFFFNLEGFRSVLSTVTSVAGSLSFDPAGCPTVDAATSAALVGQLSSAPGGGSPADFFAPLNTLSIVVEIDLDLVAAGGDIVSVWASTRARN